MDDVSCQIVTGDPITSFMHDLRAKRAVRILGPNGHAETTAETDPKHG